MRGTTLIRLTKQPSWVSDKTLADHGAARRRLLVQVRLRDSGRSFLRGNPSGSHQTPALLTEHAHAVFSHHRLFRFRNMKLDIF